MPGSSLKGTGTGCSGGTGRSGRFGGQPDAASPRVSPAAGRRRRPTSSRNCSISLRNGFSRRGAGFSFLAASQSKPRRPGTLFSRRGGTDGGFARPVLCLSCLACLHSFRLFAGVRDLFHERPPQHDDGAISTNAENSTVSEQEWN